MSKTPEQAIPKGKGTGKVTFHKGELSSKDNITTMSFGYFRTKSGLPPSVEKEQDRLKEEERLKAQDKSKA